jgi:hypothetical protein
VAFNGNTAPTVLRHLLPSQKVTLYRLVLALVAIFSRRKLQLQLDLVAPMKLIILF